MGLLEDVDNKPRPLKRKRLETSWIEEVSQVLEMTDESPPRNFPPYRVAAHRRHARCIAIRHQRGEPVNALWMVVASAVSSRLYRFHSAS